MYTRRAGAVAANRVQSYSGRQKSLQRRNRLLILGGLIAGVFGTSYYLNHRSLNHSMQKKVMLALDLSHPIEEVVKPSLSELVHPSLSFYEMQQVLEFAANDEKVAGIVAKIGENVTQSPGQVEELCRAIARLNDKGKETHCYVQSINATLDYMLASRFQRVHCSPQGYLFLTGFWVEQFFLKRMFEWLGVSPNFVQRKEYKNAVNIFLEDSFTPAHRESSKSIYQSLYQTIYQSIAEFRGLPLEHVIEQAKQSPISSSQALLGKLVDSVQHESELISKIKHGDYSTQQSNNQDDARKMALAIINQSLTEQPKAESVNEQEKSIEQVIGERLSQSNDHPINPSIKLERFQVYAQNALAKIRAKEKAQRSINRTLTVKIMPSQSTNQSNDQSNKQSDDQPTTSSPESTINQPNTQTVPTLFNQSATQPINLANQSHQSIKPAANQTPDQPNKPHSLDISLHTGGEIALVYGLGNVVDNYNQYEHSVGQFAAPILTKIFHRIANDKNISAVVFRVNSPGGSSSASDAIHAAIKEVQAAGKPVVVSMASMAASGGYYVAAPADYIFANKSTLTGSIGVYGGKFSVRNLLEKKVGLSFDSVYAGHEGDVAAGINSSLNDWDAAQRERMEQMIDRIYAEFVSKVASGRKMSLYDAEKLAHGRVWMGEQAVKLGLVDEIGGLNEAIKKAKELSHSPNAVVTVAGQKNPFKNLLKQAIGVADAEWDDEPVFSQSQSKVSQLCSMFLSQLVHASVQYLSVNMKREVAAALGVPVGGLNGQAGAEVTMNATHGELHAIVDSQGKIKLS